MYVSVYLVNIYIYTYMRVCVCAAPQHSICVSFVVWSLSVSLSECPRIFVSYRYIAHSKVSTSDEHGI